MRISTANSKRDREKTEHNEAHYRQQPTAPTGPLCKATGELQPRSPGPRYTQDLFHLEWMSTEPLGCRAFSKNSTQKVISFPRTFKSWRTEPYNTPSARSLKVWMCLKHALRKRQSLIVPGTQRDNFPHLKGPFSSIIEEGRVF